VVHFHSLIWNVNRRTSKWEWMKAWEQVCEEDSVKRREAEVPTDAAHRGPVTIYRGAAMWKVAVRQPKRKRLLDGMARIFPYDRTLGAGYYLGKYVGKGGEVDMLTFGEMKGRPDDRRLRPG
jgi:hypothetical protein